ncbi:MAG: hypothetical protein WD898_01625 [Candidatus Paceibacterota bacterium]
MARTFETLSAPEKLTEAELEAYEKLVPPHKEDAIDIEGFIDLYGQETVQKDKSRVEELEQKFEDSLKSTPEIAEYQKRGELLEAILTEQIELEDWMGGDAQTITPSRYDDIVNGVDLMVEFENEGGFIKHLALSIDATTSRHEISRKIDQIRRDIQKDHLTTIKYFASEETGFRGELREVPRVIVGADVNTIRELAGLWLNLGKAKEKRTELEKDLGVDSPEVERVRGEIRSLRTRLGEHRVQFQILEEIKLQLEYFIKLSETQGKKDIESKYKNALDTISAILAEKNIELSEEEQKKIERDRVYQTILKEISY